MNDKIERLVQEVIELAADPHVQPEVIHRKGLDAKQALWDELASYQLAVNILDGIIPYKASGLPWSIGWIDVSAPVAATTTAPTPLGVAPEQPSRTKKTLKLSQQIIDGGEATVSTKFIAAVLRKEGDSTAERALTTAIGNILNRSGLWRRVRRGEYEPIEGEVVRSQ